MQRKTTFLLLYHILRVYSTTKRNHLLINYANYFYSGSGLLQISRPR